MPIINSNGLLVENDNDIKTVLGSDNSDTAFAENQNVALLGIEFSAYSDGRGFTFAKRLRRLGFTGKLRAIGALIPDQFAELLACGFDEVEISDAQLKRQPIEQWENALKTFSLTYQNNGKSIIRQRWAK